MWQQTQQATKTYTSHLQYETTDTQFSYLFNSVSRIYQKEDFFTIHHIQLIFPPCLKEHLSHNVLRQSGTKMVNSWISKQ